MTNIIQFPAKDSATTEACYSEGSDGSLGVTIKGKGLEVVSLDNDEFLFGMGDNYRRFNRDDLAEFLWMAAIFIDDEQKWMPKDGLIGVDY